MLLAIVKLFTTVSGILSTMIMSHALSLELYGSYSQTTLIVTTATNLSALGLVDAVNYFYNRGQNAVAQQKYTNTILGLQFFTGVFAGVAVILFSNDIVAYFKNPLLHGFLWLIAFRPLFINLNVSLQYLQVSIGKATSVAIRNAGFAVLRLLVFAFVAFCFQDIRVILVIFLIYEFCITIYFGYAFIKEQFVLNPFQIDASLIKEILVYSIPMGIYVMTNSLSRDIDKMLIGGWCSTDQYAIYTNCATLLPFDIISASFLTILAPILTRYFKNLDYKSGRVLFCNYLKVGYYTSFVFTAACIILSKEMIIFLYSDKYLSGEPIFILYTIVDMIKFANMSLVLSACGKTKVLMFCSIGSLLANVILNIICYKIFGFYGPAIATVVVTVALTIVLAQMSAKALKTNVVRIIDWKDFFQFVAKLVVWAFVCTELKNVIVNYHLPNIVLIAIISSVFMAGIFTVNWKRLKNVIKEINSLR